MSIASTAFFGELSKSAENPLSKTDPETSHRYITKILVRRYRNVENSAFYGEKLANIPDKFGDENSNG
jgi:hypothetical protein